MTDGFTQGNPTWYGTDGRHSGFLAFNGVNQFVILDRSLCDLAQITVAAWVKWSGGTGNQPVFYLGTGTANGMFVTPDDGTGHAQFSITRNGATQALSWSSPLPVGKWTHVAGTLDGTNAAFYVKRDPRRNHRQHQSRGSISRPKFRHRLATKLSRARSRQFVAIFPGCD